MQQNLGTVNDRITRLPCTDRQKAYAITKKWHTENRDRRILVQRAYNYRNRFARKVARGLGVRIKEARELLKGS